jgi:hypothetical protein
MNEFPQSVKVVFGVLDHPMTHKQICAVTCRSSRTVRYALKMLEKEHLLQRKLNIKDMREIIYSRAEA